MVRVVFVCLGNICRSPMAEGVFRHLVSQAGLADSFEIDSAGTAAYHVGESPHRGTQQVLSKHQIGYRHTARQFTQADIGHWDYVIAMDASNLNNVSRLSDDNGQLKLLLDFAPDVATHDVPDPYYTGKFDHVYELVTRGCVGLLEHIRQQHGL